RGTSLRTLYESVVRSTLLRNGDAHLKNFGLLYTDPTSDDCRLSPLYDVVTTTLHLPNDRMALNLHRSREWPNLQALIKFGRETCHVSQPAEVIHRIQQAVAQYRPQQAAHVWHQQQNAIAKLK
ncbi:MAG: HipA domain-containing protein, partial [Betaproteobacteria bacterium]